MNDLINRKDAIDAIYKRINATERADEIHGLQIARELLECLPSANPRALVSERRKIVTSMPFSLPRKGEDE